MRATKVIKHDQGDVFNLKHKHPDNTHSIKDSYSPLEKYKKPKKEEKKDHFV